MARTETQRNPEKNRDIWYKLDNAAIIFPAVSGRDNTNVFRLSCELRETVDGGVLQQALDEALRSFPYFMVVMRRGLFWFYLERANFQPVVEPESIRPCARIFYKHLKEPLFRVSYFQNRVNLEVFHAVADGTGAIDLLIAVIYNYIVRTHREELPEQLPNLVHEPSPPQQSEDSFYRHYDAPAGRDSIFKQKSYQISGTLLPSGSINVINAVVSTKQLLALAKEKGATVTAYMATLMVCAIYAELMPRRARARRIGITVPVDLRGHFASESSRNFFSVVDVGYTFAGNSDAFDDVLNSISAQLREKTDPGTLSGRINYTMSVQKNPFTRFTPLILKNLILRVAYRRAERAATCALSNVGRITVPDMLVPYIDSFSCLLNPTHLHRWKTGCCSFGDKFVISFTSCIAQTSPHRYFLRHLTGAGLDVCITSNGVYEHEIL